MADKEQLKINPTVVAKYERRAKKIRLGASGDLIKSIWNGFGDSTDLHLEYRWQKGDYLNAFHPSYRELCGRPINNCETINDFFTAMVNALYFICFDTTLEKALTFKIEPPSFTYGSWGLDYRIAAELRQGNERIIALAEEAMLGDNSEIQMSHIIISGIVKSNNQRALELLGKLLLAAKGQEGLRQATEIYPASKTERINLCNQLADIAELIGKKNTKFSESVFPWFTQELNASVPCGVMLGLAAYDRSVDLTRRMADFISIMNADQRLSYYSLLLNPETPEHRTSLLEGLSDKSQTVRERIVSRLQ